MKLTAIFVAVSAVIAGASFTQATRPAHDRPVPWTLIRYKDALHWKIYAEPAGTNLRLAEPVEHRCKVYAPSNRDYMFDIFTHAEGLEFQQFDHSHIGLNCVNCRPIELGNLMSTKVGAYIHCKVGDHRSADWKPKQGN